MEDELDVLVEVRGATGAVWCGWDQQVVCGAIVEQGRKEEVPVRERWVMVVWVAVEVEENAA